MPSNTTDQPEHPEHAQYAWLDRYIKEQAAYYGVTVETFGKAMRDLADAQEQHEKDHSP